MENRKKPDVVYIAVPSLAVAEVAVTYCEKNNIPSIVDIQDLWPEAFKMVLNIPPFTNLIYSPMEKQANRVYSKADYIVAVSDTYVSRGMQVNEKCKEPLKVYLGKDKENFDMYAICSDDRVEKDTAGCRKIRLAYCGTLGHSYDIPVVLEALRNLTEEEKSRVEFIIMGDGPKRDEFEKLSHGLPTQFTGRLPYAEMVKKLVKCDIVVNPITKGAAQSIINKHMDYAFSGLPVINTQESTEYRNLIDEYQCGINCQCGNADEVTVAIRKLMDNSELRQNMGKNHRKMGEELFDRKVSYGKLIDLILSLKE